MNDLVYVELPRVGATYEAGQAFAVVESVKAASDVHARQRHDHGGEHAA